MSNKFSDNNVSASSLMADAVKETGLDDFDSTWFQPHLDRLLYEFDVTANLSEQGYATMAERFKKLLSTRLRLQEQLKKYPEINEEKVKAPIIIIGFPRTGTTKLHRMLAASGDFTTLPLWKMLDPIGDGQMTADEAARRKQVADEHAELLNKTSPDLAKMHVIETEEPEEDIQLMQHSFLTKFHHAEAGYIPGYNDYVDSCDVTPVYLELKQWLQYLQWQQGGERKPWLLKAVFHNEFLEELLTAFPDARLIQIHRPLSNVIPSWSSLVSASRKAYSSSVDPKRMGPDQLSYWLKIITKNLLVRDRRDDIKVKDFMFTDVVKNMPQVIDAIYSFAGMAPSEESLAKMLAWEADNAQHKHGKHKYSPEDFGLSAAVINQSFAAYCQRYGV